MTLWRWLEVPMTKTETDSKNPEYLLIWGGSTVTGQFATQIATASGLKVISVTSAKTKSLSETLGAQVVVRDGKSEEEIVAALREIAGDNITRAIDLVGTKTASFCLQAFSNSKPGVFAPLAMISSKALIPENVRVETVEMKQFVLNKDSRKYAVELNRLVEEGKLAY
jgi:NADPH:quinone reductase-like Zn-dependent oxidoreductase